MNMEVAKILREVRAGRGVAPLVRKQSGALNARIVTRSGPDGYREEIEHYLTEVYDQVGQTLQLDHNLRVSAELDAAQARAHWRRLRMQITQILAELNSEPSPPIAERIVACDRIAEVLGEHAELDGEPDDATA